MTRLATSVAALVLFGALNAAAQNNPPGEAAKPATTTFMGDTGLWFVPTAEVLARGTWAASGYRRGTNYIQGFSNIGDFDGTVAYGLADRVELFGAFLFDTRIDRDLRPIFTGDQTVGGIIDRYPRVNTGWTGNSRGDFYIGAKVSLLSDPSRHPLGLAGRAVVKAPTGDSDTGVSTGKADLLLDLIASRELRRLAELSGYIGYEWRGQLEGFTIPDGAFRWGIGAGVPSRGPIRGQFEIAGVVPSEDTATITSPPVIGADLTVAPILSATEKNTRSTVGVTWQNSKGFFIGGGLSWNLPTRNRELYRTDAHNFGDFVDWQVRAGFHPGTRGGSRSTTTAVATPPEPVSPSIASPAPPAPAPTPAPAAPVAAVPPSTPAQEGSATTARRSYTFEDVYFDFDRYSLRPEASRVLDDAVTAMRQDATLRLEIEGHTCNIGTAEYNLALGDRRAGAVRGYLLAQGVPADRLSVISYGEERPKYGNEREETRRLNRRAALTVNLR